MAGSALQHLRRYLRAVSAVLPTHGRQAGPASAVLALSLEGGNPIHRLLDELKLPWTAPREQVEAQNNPLFDPLNGREAILFHNAVQPTGFLEPWQASTFERYAPDMPVVRFSGASWFIDNAGFNIERTADYFTSKLGPVRIGKEYNTLVCRWQSGTASLQLQTWPPMWQPQGVMGEAYKREPRLATACHVTLLSGFRLPLTSQEDQWVERFEALANADWLIRPGPGGLEGTAPTEAEVEYARDPADHLSKVQGRVGCPPGREALILCTHQLFVIAASSVLGFEVLRLLPAKGSGGSKLYVRCRTTCLGVAYKTLYLAGSDEPDGVVRLAEKLAAIFNAPCELSPYFDDV